MTKRLWSIGEANGLSPQLFDNYKDPNRLGDVVWNADEGGSADRGERWPMFQPSEADPEGGYRLHPYTIRFSVRGTLAEAYKLVIRYLTIAPRLAYLETRLNGVSGLVHLRPQPSQSGEIVLLSGLHTTIYAEGAAELVLPGALLREGLNELQLIARDGGETIVVDRIEAIRRLDRMANGAGLLYKQLELYEAEEAVGTQVFASAEVFSTVVYRSDAEGNLRNECRFHAELNGACDGGELTLALRDGERAESVTVTVPASAFGHVSVPVSVFDGEGDVAYTLEGRLGGKPVSVSGTFRRRRKWKVFLTPHAHTDIGYTHRQWEVAERLCRNIDTALDWIESEEHFTYHLDSGWALEMYLQTRDDRRKEQLLRAIRNRKLSVAGNYVDLLTQTAGLEDMIRNHEFLADLLRPEGMRPSFDAVVDVASLTSSYPALLEDSGIRYLVHANNQDRGPFRLNGGLHKLSPFYWEGPQGGRVLCWLAKMYCELRKVCGSPPLPAAAERGLDMWLQEFERDSYAADAVLLYGQEADNTDLDPQPNEFVREWNETYAYPQLIACDVAQFFEYVEEHFADTLRTVRGDGGAYWEDGVGSSIVPTIQAREAQAMLPAAERLEALAVLHHEGYRYPLAQFDEAWRQLLLYDEHTWGAFLSATEPQALLARDQWSIKEHMSDSAKQWGTRLLHAAATRHSLSWNNDGREVVVYNPNSWTVSGPVKVEIFPSEVAIDAATGQAVPMRRLQVLPSQAVALLWIDSLPGLSYRRFVLAERPAEAEASTAEQRIDTDTYVLENGFYRVELDVRRAFATSWLDKETGRELAKGEGFGLGRLLYAEGGEGTRLMGNQSDLAEGNPLVLSDFTLREAVLTTFGYGRSVRMSGKAPYGELEVEWTLYDTEKKLEIRFHYDKMERNRKEAVYVAFPFGLADAEVRSDSQLGWVHWDRDQLPGGCKEWLPLQTGIRVETPEAAVFVASPDIPLFCSNDIVRGRWPKRMKLDGGTVFSYVLNNYWHTNYKGTQGGPVRFRYVLTSGPSMEPQQAYRFGWEARLPLYAQRMSFQDFRKTAQPYEAASGGVLAELTGGDAVVTAIKQARHGEGMIVRVQEIAGKADGSAVFRVPGQRISAASRTDLLENDLEPLVPETDGSLRVPTKSWGLTTVRLQFEA